MLSKKENEKDREKKCFFFQPQIRAFITLTKATRAGTDIKNKLSDRIKQFLFQFLGIIVENKTPENFALSKYTDQPKHV